MQGGSEARTWAGAWLAVSLALASGGCSRSGPAEPEIDLGRAVGMVAECRGLAASGGAVPKRPQQVAAENALLSILRSWLAMAPDAVGGFSMRVEVIASDAGPRAQALVEAGTRSATVPLIASRYGEEADSRIALRVAQMDEPKRTAEVGWIDSGGRIFFTGCEELFVLPPTAAEAAPEAAAAEVAAPSPARATEASPLPAPTARYFGGRTPEWWGERLVELRRDGPPELYALALLRARAAGLTVEEQAQEVRVVPPPRGDFR